MLHVGAPPCQLSGAQRADASALPPLRHNPDPYPAKGRPRPFAYSDIVTVAGPAGPGQVSYNVTLEVDQGWMDAAVKE